MKAYRIVAHLISLCVVLQAGWIALSTFLVIHDVDNGKVIDKSFEGNAADGLHFIFGQIVIPLLALTLLAIAFLSAVPGGRRSAGFVVLAVVLQITLAYTAFSVPAVGFLHALNAFVVLGLAELAAHRAGSTREQRVREAFTV
jgi:hypothetical protein